MYGRGFGDVEAICLHQLASLRFLQLTDTEVTDAALEHLERLTNLNHLDLTNTRVTPEGVTELQKALPECEIVY